MFKRSIILKYSCQYGRYGERIIKLRHIEHCYEADPAYGQGVAGGTRHTFKPSRSGSRIGRLINPSSE